MTSDNFPTWSDDETVKVTTKPCWICGQHTEVFVPIDAWNRYYVHDVHLDLAWPDGPADTKQLIRTGVHPACWDAEFPIPTPSEQENKNA